MTGAMVACLLASARATPASTMTGRGSPAEASRTRTEAIFRAIRHTPTTQPTGLIGLARQAPIACRGNTN